MSVAGLPMRLPSSQQGIGGYENYYERLLARMVTLRCKALLLAPQRTILRSICSLLLYDELFA
jgi:hypothetical protein